MVLSTAEYCREWRKRNKEKIRKYARAYRYKNPDIISRKNRKYLYQVTDDLFQQLLSKQNHKCAVCDTEFSDTEKPHIDHDHSCCSGQRSCGKCIRGLLCTRCNKAIGSFKDSTTLLQKAINYLSIKREHK